jgi:ABC-type transporter Mla subunit MlaD
MNPQTPKTSERSDSGRKFGHDEIPSRGEPLFPTTGVKNADASARRQPPRSSSQIGFNQGEATSQQSQFVDGHSEQREKVGAIPEAANEAVDEVAASVSSATETVTNAASEIGEVAKQAVKATVKAVSEQASALTSNIASELTTTAETQKDRGADVMQGFAKAIRTAAGELDQQSPQVARTFRGAATSVESLSHSLRGQSIGELFGAASGFARKQPVAFFAGAVVAGFALSRFLKSHKAPADPNDASGSAVTLGASRSFAPGVSG